MNKPIAQFLVWCLALTPPIYAQEAIEIEIDSAPVEVEIQKPAPAAEPEEPAQQTADTPQADEKPAESAALPEKEPDNKRRYGVAIAIGAIVAGALAALGGGGGGGGGTDTPPQHP